MSLPTFPVLPGLTYTVLKTPGFDTLVMSAPNKYEVRIQQTINPIWTYTLIYDFLHDFFWGGYSLVSELRTLMGFFNQMGGKALPFLLTDPDDYNVGPALGTFVWMASTVYPLGYGILDSSNHWQKVTTAGTSGSSIPTFNHSGSTTSDGSVVWQDEGGGYTSGFPNTFLAGLSLVNDGVGNYYSPIQRTLNGFFFEDITDLNGSIAVYNNATLATAGSGAGQYTLLGPGLAIPTASYMGMYLKWNTGLSAWQATHSYATNAEILDPSGHIQKATTGGTSGGTIPTFNDSGGTTTDGGVTWTDQGYNPGPVGPISAQFNFYFRVRFDTDEQDFEKFLGIGSAASNTIAGQGGGYWTIGGSEAQNGAGTLKLTTARPVPL
jgi:hypothetical protein